jgi:hypothetical protein
VLAAWNDSTGFHPPGDVSGVSTAISHNFGGSWAGDVRVPTGSPSLFILGEPSAVYDPFTNRFVVAYDSVEATEDGLSRALSISRSTGRSTSWSTPVDTFPGIPLDSAFAHGGSLATDPGPGPGAGNIYLAFTLSFEEGESEVALTTSTNGGGDWEEPVSVSGLGTYDHAEVAVGPGGVVYVTWTDYGGSSTSPFDILFSRSTNGGQTFSNPVQIRQGSPRSGTPGQCTGSSLRTVLGSAAVFDTNQIAVDPYDPQHIYAVYSIHGQGSDESDLSYTTSGDGGRTWSAPEPVGPSAGTQWAPDIAVTPDGRVAITYHQSQDGSTVDPTVAFYDPFADRFVGEPQSLTDGNPFPLWNVDPSFDSTVANCFGLGGIDAIAPGSGFGFAWADGRDPGPAGNDGIDPNIYFMHDLGPFLATSTSLSVATTAAKLEASGKVSPQPLRGAVVRVTLARDTGDGFEQVAGKNARIDENGSYSTSFTRPVGGTCMITVVFQGSEGREPSPSTSKTFAC